LIEKRKKINIGKEQKVDSRSKIERATGDENSNCINWKDEQNFWLVLVFL